MHMHTYPYSRLGMQLTEVGESFYNEYIPPVLEHLEQVGVVTDSAGARVIWPPGTCRAAGGKWPLRSATARRPGLLGRVH